jgi:selenide,water dikinase
VLSELPVPTDPRVLIDYRTHDDAGVYRLDNGVALVQTVDFFTPIVDDPYDYGQIAAANALSDVYAMGGRPLTALAVAALPQGEIDPDVVRAIFKGGHDKLREAGVALLGGHTVRDAEVKFGYAVTGTVDPGRVWSNAGARPGAAIVITKPLGTGIIATAIKHGRAPADVAAAAIESMRRLNAGAASALAALPPGAVQACTDVTGFGLVGHASEVARASQVTLRIDPASLPWLPGALDLALTNPTGGGKSNRTHFAAGTKADSAMSDAELSGVHDPQTSGGLFAVLSRDQLSASLEALRAVGAAAWIIGDVVTREGVDVRLSRGAVAGGALAESSRGMV